MRCNVCGQESCEVSRGGNTTTSEAERPTPGSCGCSYCTGISASEAERVRRAVVRGVVARGSALTLNLLLHWDQQRVPVLGVGLGPELAVIRLSAAEEDCRWGSRSACVVEAADEAAQSWFGQRGFVRVSSSMGWGYLGSMYTRLEFMAFADMIADARTQIGEPRE
jgi:hypothetical protein